MTDAATVYALTLPMPPLLNRLYHPRADGRGLYKSSAADAYAWDVLAAARERGIAEPLAGAVEMVVRFTTPRLCDVDAVAKCLLDACEGVLYVDDRQIARLVIERTVAPGPAALTVEVRAL